MKKIFAITIVTYLVVICIVGCSETRGGTVSTDGSTSMSKVIGALGEAYEKETGVKVTYNPTGSGSGIVAVQEGRCDIGLSSRELKDEEKNADLTETVFAYDGISVIVNPKNPISDLTLDQIADIYTGKITNWNEVGGTDGAIVLVGREANSGTRDGFETIIGAQEKCQYRQELSSNGDVITTVANNSGAIGYASLATVKNTVKVLCVDGVAPCEESVKDGSYKLQRPFILVTKENVALSEMAQKFFDYVTQGKANEIISAAGAISVN